MTRFHGTIGFEVLEDDGTGVFRSKTVTREYFGDVERGGYRYDHGYSVNDHVVVTNYISIVADAFAFTNIGSMRWLEVDGVPWAISSAEMIRPRIKLTLGGVYNAGLSDGTASDPQGDNPSGVLPTP